MKDWNWKTEIGRPKLEDRNWKTKIERPKLKDRNWKSEIERPKLKNRNWKTKFERLKLKDRNWKTEIKRLELRDWNWKTEIERLKLKDWNWKTEIERPIPSFRESAKWILAITQIGKEIYRLRFPLQWLHPESGDWIQIRWLIRNPTIVGLGFFFSPQWRFFLFMDIYRKIYEEIFLYS